MVLKSQHGWQLDGQVGFSSNTLRDTLHSSLA